MHYNKIADVSFLSSLFKNGLFYNGINAAQSSLSTILISGHVITIGACAIVRSFMKGVFELRPQTVRYKCIWDVNIVLNYLKNFFPLCEVSLDSLT